MGPSTRWWRLTTSSRGRPSLPSTSASGPKGRSRPSRRSVYFGGSMSLSEGLHVERTEFLGTDQSKDGQELMLEYLADIESTGELPLYQPDTYAHALESGRVPAVGIDQRGGEAVSDRAALHPPRRFVHLRRVTPVPHGFTCPPASPRRPWSSSGTASAPPARCVWMHSPSGSHRPVSPPWPSPIGTSATAAANPASSCRSNDSSPTGTRPSLR